MVYQLRSRRRRFGPALLPAVILLLVSGCSVTQRTSVAPSEIVVLPDGTDRPTCHDLGKVEEIDGPCAVDTRCDCAAKQLEHGSADAALLKARTTTARRGGNVLWIREETSSDSYKTHLEACCHVTCHRVVAVAFSCDQRSNAGTR